MGQREGKLGGRLALTPLGGLFLPNSGGVVPVRRCATNHTARRF